MLVTPMPSMPCLKLQCVKKWARQHLGSIAHEQRVLRIARILWRLTADWHGLDRGFRRLLELAALTHDVGRAINDRDHPRIGAKMVLRDPDLPLRKGQRRRLAFLVLAHRGRPPQPGKEPLLRPKDSLPAMRLVLALLRAADALDSRVHQPPRLLFQRRGRTIHITAHLVGAQPKTVRAYQRPKKFRMLEHELGCRVELNVKAQPALRMAA